MALPEDVGYIEILERPDLDQPFHVRLVDSGNHARVFWTEDYVDAASAHAAVEWLGRMFSPVGKAYLHVFEAPVDGAFLNDISGWLTVWLDDVELGAKVAIPVRSSGPQ